MRRATKIQINVKAAKEKSEQCRRRGNRRSEQEEEQETQGDREDFSTEQNVVIYLRLLNK